MADRAYIAEPKLDGHRAQLHIHEYKARRVGQRTLADVSIAYRICHGCLNEKTVFALRMSA